MFLWYGIDWNLMFVVLNNSSGYCNVISCIDIVVFGYNIIFFLKIDILKCCVFMLYIIELFLIKFC